MKMGAPMIGTPMMGAPMPMGSQNPYKNVSVRMTDGEKR